MSLQAVVIGSGWAGEGHTIALRAAGVEVVAMCGRTPEPAIAKARKLGIPNVRFDWREAVEEFKPHIVSIATPARPHREMAEAAASLGCHVVCEKPLATNARDARAMLTAVEKAGVKHAYCTTSRYGPAVIYGRKLIADGLIGQVREVESIAHTGDPSQMPFNWFHQLSEGGGLLNNLFTHKLGQVLHVTGGEVVAAAGEARRLIERAPVGPRVHDFRELFGPAIYQKSGEPKEWREVDADFGYTVMIKLRMPDGHIATALFQASVGKSPCPDYLALHGTKGTLCLTGPNSPDRIHHFDWESRKWEEMPIPQEIMASLPQADNFVQRDWNHLFREFVADVRGESYAGYPTFRDGWVAAEIIEIARTGQSWIPLPV